MCTSHPFGRRTGFILLALLVLIALPLAASAQPAADVAQPWASAPLAEAQAAPAAAALDLTAVVPAPLCPGGVIRYTLTLRNTASVGDLLAAEIIDPIPANTSYVAGSATNGAVFETASNRVTWQGRLGPGENAVVVLDARVNNATANGAITNDASGTLTDPAGGSSSAPARHIATVNCPTPTPTRTPTATNTPPVIVNPPTATPTQTPPVIVNPPTATPTKTPPVITLPSATPTKTPTPTRTPTRTPTPKVYDLDIQAIEVTQGTQNLANQMPLIQDRRTIVRVHIREMTGSDVSGVRARLVGKRTNLANGTPVNQDLGVLNAKNQPITVKASSPNRTILDRSFWFYLPSSWRSGTVEFTADVNYDKAINESDFADNQASVKLKFNAAKPLNVLIFPMEIHEGGSKKQPAHIYYCQNEPNCDDLYLNALRRHPISTMNVWLAADALDATFGKWGPDKDDMGDMLKKLDWVRFWYTDVADDLHYFGTIDDFFDPQGASGMGRSPGWSAVGHMLYSVGGTSTWWMPRGNTVAHELAHNKGLKHVACLDASDGNDGPPDGIADEIAGGATDPNYPWKFPNCRIAPVDPAGYYGLDVYYGVWGLAGPAVIGNDPSIAQPNRGWPMMSYQSLRWVSPWEYCKLMSSYGVSCGINWGNAAAAAVEGPSPALQAAVVALQSADEHLLVGGQINRADGSVLFDPAYRQTGIAPSMLAKGIAQVQALLAGDADPEWLLTLEDASGNVLASRPLVDQEDEADTAAAPAHPGVATFGFLELLPFPANTQWVRVRHNGAVAGEQMVSAHAPQVTLLGPNSGRVEVGTVINWQASDADGDPLRFTVLYSGDSGTSWRPLMVHTEASSLEITAGLLHDIPGGSQGVLKVIATDGINTGEDVSTSPLTAPNTPPDLMLGQSGETIFARPGALVVLEGGATDVEDGVIPDDSLRWQSNLDGQLDSGRELATDTLSRGKHTLTLTATDSQGATSQASLTVVVGDPSIYLPTVLR